MRNKFITRSIIGVEYISCLSSQNAKLSALFIRYGQRWLSPRATSDVCASLCDLFRTRAICAYHCQCPNLCPLELIALTYTVETFARGAKVGVGFGHHICGMAMTCSQIDCLPWSRVETTAASQERHNFQADESVTMCFRTSAPGLASWYQRVFTCLAVARSFPIVCYTCQLTARIGMLHQTVSHSEISA